MRREARRAQLVLNFSTYVSLPNKQLAFVLYHSSACSLVARIGKLVQVDFILAYCTVLKTMRTRIGCARMYTCEVALFSMQCRLL